ncbi:hypothetical protein K1719_045462 [Acacia pycnantha]|nr:hypothetical protein K1719_045462 [Acacia pycnantha]
MIAKRSSKKRIHNLEPERKLGKMPESNKSNGKGKKSSSGSRFDVLQEVEDRTNSKGVDRLRKTEVATSTWRRKEVRPYLLLRKESLASFRVIYGGRNEGKGDESERKEGNAANVLVGQSVILSQATDDYNIRPHDLSSVRNKKKAARAHNVIFGSTKTIESSKVSETEEQAEGKKKNYEENEIVEIEPCNPDILDSSTIITKNAKNDDVDRGEKDSEVVPASLPLDKLIKHIADDADFTESQESLVADTQFELGQEPDAGHSR